MLWVAFRWHGLALSAPALYRAALQRIDSVPLCYEQTFLSDGRACFHPLSKKGRSAVWLAWIGCGLHILQISTAASACRRFLIDTLDSSLHCQHQYMQWQKIFWNNQCLGALKLCCYHLVKWHFQPFLACDLLQKSNKKHYSYRYSKEQPSSIKIFQVILLKYPLSRVSEEIPVWVSSFSPCSFDLSQTWQVYC